jgi:acyl CoA:acetate/3-ketoacid CoA transferase alpha subunit
VAKQLKLAKKAGMTCAIRTGGDGLDFVMCKDEVGTFRLK